jgi:hypothetical protein
MNKNWEYQILWASGGDAIQGSVNREAAEGWVIVSTDTVTTLNVNQYTTRYVVWMGRERTDHEQ